MTYKELMKALANYDGDWDDEVVFVNYNKKAYNADDNGYPMYHVTSIGCGDKKCRLNNCYDNVYYGL